MLDEPGLYWGRVADEWFLVNVTLWRVPGSSRFGEVQAFIRQRYGVVLTKLSPYNVEEWGEKVAEPASWSAMWPS